jgi:hypothetical protein
MLAGTAGGDAYTFAELEKMFRNAGSRVASCMNSQLAGADCAVE